MANISQIKRQKMLEFLNKIKEEHKDDDEMLIALGEIEKELNAKKYGLVWEEHEEDIELKMQTHIPVFSEVPSMEIQTKKDSSRYNFLLEGDNLHSLFLLLKTHRGRIDVIYIDPPYNTGARDWKYNNDFVDGTDSFRHSKWLSWMRPRLVCAKELLSSKGIIVVTIDDYEFAALQLLMDEVFGEENHLGTVIIRNNPSGRSTVRGFSVNHEYALFYAKSDRSTIGRLQHSEEQKSRYKEEDSIGSFEWENFRKNGTDSDRPARPKQFYPIVLDVNNEKLRIPNVQWNDSTKSYDVEDQPSDTEIVLYPVSPKGEEKVWKYGIDRARAIIDEILVKKTKNGYELYRKKYLNAEGSLPHTWWDKPEYSARDNGTRELTNIFGSKKAFDFPKAPQAVKDCLIAANLPQNGIVLDFFAGSGTTGQAVLELNKEDNGQRSFILCTNNENNICESVTYQRLKTVITGKRQDGSNYSDGIPANLLYLRTGFVEKSTENLSDELLEHVREMIQLENGIKLDNKKYIMILNDDEADELADHWDEYPDVTAIYASKNVLFTTRQNTLFKGIDIHIIPDYYFNFELREVGETW